MSELGQTATSLPDWPMSAIPPIPEAMPVYLPRGLQLRNSAFQSLPRIPQRFVRPLSRSSVARSRHARLSRSQRQLLRADEPDADLYGRAE